MVKIKEQIGGGKAFFLEMKKHYLFFLGFLILLGLYSFSHYNYLLFHILSEGFSIVIAIAIFIIAWNSRKFFKNDYLLFVGVAYLFIAGIDLVHTLVYPGMTVTKVASTNLASQLWIGARFLQAISLLIAPIFISRKLSISKTIISYGLVVGCLLISVFFGFFPTTFVEGSGLTQFKIISEYIISIILVGAVLFLWKYKDKFNRSIFYLITASLIFTIFSELAFTFYISPYGLSNLIGHILKIIAFYLIYRALTQTNLMRVKIRSILLKGAGISIILILMFSLMVYVGFNNVAEENERELIANDIHKTVSELDIILYDYITHREERMLQQWNLNYEATNKIINKIESEKVKSNYADLKNLFLQITENYEKQGSSELEERLVAQFLIKSQEIISDSSAISKEAYNNAMIAQKKANDSMAIALVILFFTLLGVSLHTSNRITNPLRRLIEGTIIIGKGNLKHRIDVQTKDELEELATAFNEMTFKLEKVNKNLKESNRLKDLFNDIMRHDFLNPAGTMKMSVQAALMEKQSEETRELLKRCYRCSERLIKMIENASIISKLEAKEKLEFKEEDLGTMLKESVEELNERVKEKGMKVRVVADGKFPAVVNPLIQNVFSNFISNAIKYSPEKTDVVVGIKEKGNDWLVYVEDRGEGIPAKYKKAIFERFTRLEKGAIKGSGLGLAISKKIAEAHNGKIWVRDHKGGGSVFYVLIPKVHKENVFTTVKKTIPKKVVAKPVKKRLAK